MNIILLEIIVLLGALVVAPLLHLIIAYVIAPKRAKLGILDALVGDSQFQEKLMGALVISSSKPMQFKDEQGQNVTSTPIQVISSIISSQFLQTFNKSIAGKQSQMIQDMERNAETSMQMMPQNPMMALALQQIPKKYLPYLQILMNMYANQNQSQ